MVQERKVNQQSKRPQSQFSSVDLAVSSTSVTDEFTVEDEEEFKRVSVSRK